jgi:hypothetical protein
MKSLAGGDVDEQARLLGEDVPHEHTRSCTGGMIGGGRRATRRCEVAMGRAQGGRGSLAAGRGADCPP